MKKIFNTAIFLTVFSGIAQQKITSPDLIEVAEFGKNQPIGVTVSNDNRLFVSFPKRHPYLYGLTEIVNGKRIAFPDAEWNVPNPQKPESHFVNVQDLFTDSNNDLWVLDSKPGGANSVFGKEKGDSEQGQFKLLQIDLKSNSVKKVYHFEDLPKDKSALNDVTVDTQKQLAYFSDPGLKAIVILDLKTGKTRIVLQNDKSTIATPGFILNLDGKDVIGDSGKPFVSNVNGIALTNDNNWFYFRAINQNKLYRIQTQFLADSKLTPEVLSSKVATVAETGVCHGMIADSKGNIYLSSSPDYSIKYVSPDGRLHTLVQDSRLSWPDSFGIGTDGFLYFSCSQLNRLPKYNNKIDRTDFPYRVYKVRLPK